MIAFSPGFYRPTSFLNRQIFFPRLGSKPAGLVEDRAGDWIYRDPAGE